MIWGFINENVIFLASEREAARGAEKHPHVIYFFADLHPLEPEPHMIHVALSLVTRKSYPCYCGIFDKDHTPEELRALLYSSERV